MSAADFTAFQKQYKKDRIVEELAARESSFPVELAKLTGSAVQETEQLIDELVSEKLVENVVGKYYKLTYEGYKLARARDKGIEVWKRY